MHQDDTSGVMAIEACVSLTFFMIIMYALYSMVTLFSAQSIIGHALSESCQSLALENYSTSKSDGAWSVSQVPVSLVNTRAKFLGLINACSANCSTVIRSFRCSGSQSFIF